MASGGAKIVVGADVSDVKPKLDSVSQAVGTTAQEVNGKFQGWVGNTNAVASATEKLERQLKAFASEQRQQGRLATFYANELIGIVPAADSAKSALQELAGVFIEGATGGLSFGLAFEAAKFAVGAITNALEEARKEAEATEKAIGAIQDRIDAIGKSKRQRMLEEIAKLDGAIKAVAAGDKAPRIDYEGNLVKSAEFEAAEKRLQEYADKYKVTADNLGQVLLKLQAEYAAEESALRTEAAIEQAKAVEKARAEASDRARAALGKIAEQGAKDGETRAKAELETYWRTIRQGLAAEAMQQPVAATSIYGRTGLRGIDEGVLTRAQFGLTNPVIDTAAFGKRENEALEPLRKMRLELDLIGQAGAQVESIFASIGTAIGGMAGSMINLFGKLIQQAIQLAIAIAGSSGPLGWLTVAGAAAAIIATVSSVPEFRRDGGTVMNYRPYLVGEAGPELFVPSQAGTIVPNAGATGAVTVNIQAVDAASFERMLRSNDNALFRVLREGRRAGRA